MSSGATDSAMKSSGGNGSTGKKAGLKGKRVKPLSLERHFSREGVHPFDSIEWEKRTATIADEKGEVIFEQKNVEVPKFFSQLATKVVVSKYFYGEVGTDEREKSLKEQEVMLFSKKKEKVLRLGMLLSNISNDWKFELLSIVCFKHQYKPKNHCNCPYYIGQPYERRYSWIKTTYTIKAITISPFGCAYPANNPSNNPQWDKS